MEQTQHSQQGDCFLQGCTEIYRKNTFLVLWEIFLRGFFMRIRSNKTDYEETKRSDKSNGGRELAAFLVFAEHEITEIAVL